MTDWLLAINFFLHLMATVVWIGGLMLVTFVLWPEVRGILARNPSEESQRALTRLLDRLRKRFYPLANLSLVVLIATGIYQMGKNRYYEGLLQFNNDWSRAILFKHIAVIGMVGIGVLMQWGIIPAMERTALLMSRQPDEASSTSAALRRREQRLTALNAILGIIVLACTAAATAAR